MSNSYKLGLLAAALKDNEPVHPGLREPCLDGHMAKDPVRHVIWHGDCEDFNCPGYRLNPDPIALIAAALKQGWEVKFFKDGTVAVIFGNGPGDLKLCVSTDEYAALADAMVKLTKKKLEPDNWGPCSYCDEDNEDGYVVFDDKTNERINYKDDGTEWVDTCEGTGIVIKEETCTLP